MSGIRPSALELIGDTPLVALDRIHPGPGRLLAKAEMVGPGGSVKDRPARHIVLAARASGALRPGQGVVEMTSGNMGAGLAVVCAVLGHPFAAVMSSGNSAERAAMLRGLGARVVLVPQIDGKPGEVTGADVREAARRARALAAQEGAYYVDQFHNPGSVDAHRETTGPEIWAQTGGRIDAFVAAVGGGGTFVGTAQALKARDPRVRCLAVEPVGCAPLAGEVVVKPRHLLQGVGYGTVPPHFDPAVCDGTLAVSDEDARAMRRRLARLEGLYLGYTAAANVVAAQRLLDEGGLGPEAVVVTILCDTGLKYPPE